LALPTGPVVAVLPFENLSDDPKQEYFSDGLTDDIITALSKFKDLFVIALVRKAMKLDPFHPTWFNLPIAHYHFESGEQEEALAAAKKADMPGLYSFQAWLAGIYAELGRQSEARCVLEELFRLYPDFTVEKYIEEARKWNFCDETIRRFSAALRKAGLPG
jgi:adenylate cyclase